MGVQVTKVALLIGVAEYEPGFTPLPGTRKDLQAMERVLKHPKMGGFDQVTVLPNPDTIALQSAIESLFADRQRDDLVLFYFSGHGVKEEDGTFYFVTHNTRKRDEHNISTATAVPARFLQDCMSRSRSKRQVVVLDCCFSGAFAQGMTAKAVVEKVDIAAQLGGEGRVVLTSSSAIQYSFEQKEESIYTRYLVEGIEKGAADTDNDGMITVDELHEYAKRKVQESTPAMKPQIYATREGYRIVVATAPQNDPRVEYRKEVERLAQERQGNLSSIVLRGLNRKRQQWQLPEPEADAIREQVLEPFREFQRKVQEYEQALAEALAEESPLSEATRRDLKYLQGVLGLRDEDISPVEDPHPPTPSPWGEGERIQSSSPSGEGFRASARALSRAERATNGEPARQPQLQRFEFEVVTVNPQGKEASRTRKAGMVFAEDLGNGVVLEMVQIPGGKFQMGSPKGEGDDREKPQHGVTVPAFCMGRYPVTQAQWQGVAALPQIQRALDADPSGFKGDNRPVEQVSWWQAVEFCQRLSVLTGRDYRLPTEAEWEYACRAGTTTPFHFGETITTDLANYDGTKTYKNGPKGEYRKETTPVDRFRIANAFGLAEMHGNVWELCQDHWHGNYRGAPMDGSAWLTDDENTERVIRGGSWYNDPANCRAANRIYNSPAARCNDIGFRVVCSVCPGLF